jgi:hypothetical protein
MQAQQRLKCLVVTLVALTLSTVAEAQVHLQIPEDSDAPVYANFSRGFMPHTEEWAVVIFYRTPDCVPADFNLLDFFDPPPRPFLCDLQIKGRSNSPSLDFPFPAEIFLQGTGAVPLWFVRWPELQAAVADDDLTVAELAALPSLLIGSASFYHESIRNDIRGRRGGTSVVVASGTLTDGRSFQVQYTEKFREGENRFQQVRIDFK